MFTKQKPKRWSKVKPQLIALLTTKKIADERETMIVFVYDTECLKDEADDPVNAVLYFHPSWVSDTQKVALCGQLMGTTYFLKDCFFKPKVISLQNGKFVLKEFGRFTLAVGTDRNISDYLLQQRADLLAALIRLFHRDLQTISEQFAPQSQYKNLGDKLYHIFETYLPILQQNGHIFQNVPKLRIPKTASNIFLDAMQTLQCCQETKGILGGAILYHNKVVATQLNDKITKQLVLTDPLHIRTTAEQINSTDFHIPNGVQMIIVYIDALQYRILATDAQRAQHLQTTQLSHGVLPFQFAKRKMKRDKSLIFTHIPEEGSNLNASADQVDATSASIDATINNSETQQAIRPKSLLMRPTHLPLRMKNMSTKELPESGIASINFDESDSYPEFIGRTSVCSTPMTENKVLHVANIMSICANPEEENNSNKLQTSNTQNRSSSLKLDFEKFIHNFMSNSNKQQIERRSSLTDLQDSLKKISKKLSRKQFTPHQEQKTDVNRNGASASETPDFIENDDNDDDNQSSDNSSFSNNKSIHTISDPTNPVFNSNGQPISRSLFQELLEKYYKLWDASKDESKPDEEILQLIAEFREFDEELKKLDASLRQENAPSDIATITVKPNLKTDRNLNIGGGNRSTPKTPLDKKTLSLPLKPLTDATSSGGGGEYGPPLTALARKQSSGVPLTPLMAKLSVLAFSEEQRNNWDATPGGGPIEIQTPLNASKTFTKRGSIKCDDAVDAISVAAPAAAQENTTDNAQQRVELYICGQQNMTLLLLMETGSAVQQNVVQKMFDICVAKFPHMESQLNQSLNVNVEGDKRDGSYSFMCVDSKWDAYERKGPWNTTELITLEHMQRQLRESKDFDVTDLILRSHDNVFYGYKSARTELFYKEPVTQHTTGIPPPSDIMGSVAIRAKKRLERDHSYVLF